MMSQKDDSQEHVPEENIKTDEELEVPEKSVRTRTLTEKGKDYQLQKLKKSFTLF